jgi:hypothetical protein
MGTLRGCLAAVAVVGLLAGCGHAAAPPAASGGFGNVDSPSPITSSAPPSVAPSTPPPVVTTTSAAPAVPALTCDQLKTAYVGSTTISYNGYHDSIPLGGGVWSGEDGWTVTLQKPCGIGDLNGDGARDAVGVVVRTNAGTGQFSTLVVWRNAGGQPECAAVTEIGDRNPVVSITIASQKATVVYLTRTSDQPMAVVNVKRTATYHLVGSHFTEISHTDAPYSG